MQLLVLEGLLSPLRSVITSIKHKLSETNITQPVAFIRLPVVGKCAQVNAYQRVLGRICAEKHKTTLTFQR